MTELDRLLEYLRERTVEVGDCWEWNGCVQHRGLTPMMRWDGVARGVRRVLAELKGMPVAGRMTTARCLNRLCVSPDHVQVLTRRQLQIRTGKLTGMQSAPTRAYKLAVAARRTAKLTEQQVAEIRAMTGLPQHEIARRYGVAQATVSAIKRGVKWKDYHNPWAQLMGMSR